MFHPGETVSHTFIIPFAATEVAKVIITYKQNDCIILTKTITSGISDSINSMASIDVDLTQEESLLFEEKASFTIQLNVFTNNGRRITSNEIVGENGAQHYKEVITNG